MTIQVISNLQLLQKLWCIRRLHYSKAMIFLVAVASSRVIAIAVLGSKVIVGVVSRARESCISLSYSRFVILKTILWDQCLLIFTAQRCSLLAHKKQTKYWIPSDEAQRSCINSAFADWVAQKSLENPVLFFPSQLFVYSFIFIVHVSTTSS